MAVKFDWKKYQSGYPKLPRIEEQWKRILENEKGVLQEALRASKVREALRGSEEARIKGQKEGLRIIAEEVAPFARYVIRNPKGDLVGIVNDQEQLRDQLQYLKIDPDSFDPRGFNAQGKQEIGKYRIYDNAIREKERKILEIAHPKVAPLHKRINVPLLINERMQDAETETRASSVPIPRGEIEALDEEIKEKEERREELREKYKGLFKSKPEPSELNEKFEGKDITFKPLEGKKKNYAKMPDEPEYYIVYDPKRSAERLYSVVKGLGRGGGLKVYGRTLAEAIEKGREAIEKGKK